MVDQACKITIIRGPVTQDIEVTKGVNLHRALIQGHIGSTIPHSPCGGKGTCGKCKVILHGKVSDPTPTELSKLTEKELNTGIRLACQVIILGDVRAEIIEEHKFFLIQVEGLPYQVEISPVAERKLIHLPGTSLLDNRDDTQRLLDTLGNRKFRLSPIAISKLAQYLHGGEQDIRVTIMDDRIIDITPDGQKIPDYGFAVDIGSTTLVGYLVNMETGSVESTVSELNDQRAFGADVISRISYGMEKPGGYKEFQGLIVSQIDKMLKTLLDTKQIPKEALCGMAFAGNTIMMHFLMGLKADRIAAAPFTPVYTSSYLGIAHEWGFKYHPHCAIYLLPCISGYVGADIVAGILACSLRDKNKVQLLVDIGTNGEMALSKKGKILCCSVAAGPAFEGACIRCGVGGIEGAIDAVTFKDGALGIHTLWEKKPVGLCGSGLVDALAILLELGIINEAGRFADDEEWRYDAVCLKARVQDLNDEKVFIVAYPEEAALGNPIYLCQQDIREVQLAKAAIHAGIKTLVQHQAIAYDAIDILWLAGGFGNKLRKESALTLGLLPKELATKIQYAGNASGTGCLMALLSGHSREECDSIKEETHYLELSGLPGFNDAFIDAIGFDID